MQPLQPRLKSTSDTSNPLKRVVGESDKRIRHSPKQVAHPARIQCTFSPRHTMGRMPSGILLSIRLRRMPIPHLVGAWSAKGFRYSGEQGDPQEKIEDDGYEKDIDGTDFSPDESPDNRRGDGRQARKEAKQPAPAPLLIDGDEFHGHGTRGPGQDRIEGLQRRVQYQHKRPGRKSERQVGSIPQRRGQIDDAFAPDPICQSSQRNTKNQSRYNCSASHYTQEVLVRALDLVGIKLCKRSKHGHGHGREDGDDDPSAQDWLFQKELAKTLHKAQAVRGLSELLPSRLP